MIKSAVQSLECVCCFRHRATTHLQAITFLVALLATLIPATIVRGDVSRGDVRAAVAAGNASLQASIVELLMAKSNRWDTEETEGMALLIVNTAAQHQHELTASEVEAICGAYYSGAAFHPLNDSIHPVERAAIRARMRYALENHLRYGPMDQGAIHAAVC